MKKWLFSVLSILLSITLILSSCKKEEDAPTEIPDPDPTIDFIGDIGYISIDTKLPINAIFKVGITANNSGSSKKLVSFVAVRTFMNLPADTVVNHSFYSPDFSWESAFTAMAYEGDELWLFTITDESGKSAELSFTITTIDPVPTISFLEYSTYISSDTLLEKEVEFDVGILAAGSSSGMELASFSVVRNFEHNPEIVLDKALTGHDFSWDSTFYASPEAGEETWTFTILDIAGESAVISFIITTEDTGGGDVVYYPDVKLGSYNSTNYGPFFSTSTGQVYFRNEATQQQELIDFAFYFGATNKATLGAPSNIDVVAVYDLVGLGWTWFNETLFQVAPVTASEFDAIGSGYTFPPFTGGEDDINHLEINDVVFFKTHDEKLGYIKVNSINSKGDFTNIDVKVGL